MRDMTNVDQYLFGARLYGTHPKLLRCHDEELARHGADPDSGESELVSFGYLSGWNEIVSATTRGQLTSRISLATKLVSHHWEWV